VYYALLLDEPYDPQRPAVESKRAMARALTARYHGDAAAAAEAHFDRLHVERAAPDEVDEHTFTAADDGTVHLPALLADAFGISRSEGRRLLQQSGVKLDGELLQGDALDVPAAGLDGRVLQVGRRRFRRLRLT
jgi:tyrosyl-tRNA synthetase